MISSPEAARFVNERVRPAADELVQAYYRAVAVRNEWFATDMGSVITNTSDEVADGASSDGRHVVTGADIVNVITRLIEFTGDLEEFSNAKLNTLLPVVVNPLP
jgi:hypothetical protein